MTIDKRKAELREYIEAYKFALNGVYEDDNGNGVSENIDRWLTWEIKAANESARIAEQLLELIEASQKVLKIQYGAQGYYEENDWEGLSEYYGNLIIQYQDELRIALNKIAGEK